MKLYIKQKVFSFNDKFTVKDETGADRYFVEGEIFTLGKKLHVYDANQTERIFYNKKFGAFFQDFLFLLMDCKLLKL
jgi:uncharacterized protein YxjI